MAQLLVHTGLVKHRGRAITALDLDEALAAAGASALSVGRAPGNDLVLESDLAVSRERHAQLVREGHGGAARWWIENHTDRPHRVRVNGAPLPRGERRVLGDGSEVVIGRSTWLRFRADDGGAAAALDSTLDASGDGPATLTAGQAADLAAGPPPSAAGVAPTILGVSRAIRAVVEQIRIAATSDIGVLILGETGVGKELVARAVHDASARRRAPFVAVNTPALSAELFESELFGHERGAFTGAAQEKPGFVEAAGTGTLFLDEVGELPAALQPKLLRLLENGTFVRVGSTRERRARARIVAATNRDLKSAAAAGAFRHDLYYRLAGFPIHVPPLRERCDDIPVLVRATLGELARAESRRVTIEPEAMEALVAHDWPGNVRELRMTVKRLALTARSGVIALADLPAEIRAGESGFLDGFRERWRSRDFATRVTLDEVERAARAVGSRAALARWLGEKSRSTFYARLKRLPAEAPTDAAETDPAR
jgi:DNA-binding NtrC family response regulator